MEYYTIMAREHELGRAIGDLFVALRDAGVPVTTITTKGHPAHPSYVIDGSGIYIGSRKFEPNSGENAAIFIIRSLNGSISEDEITHSIDRLVLKHR